MISQTKMQMFQNHYLEKENISFIWVNFTNMVAIIFFQADVHIWLTTPPPLPVWIFPLLPDPPPPLMCRLPLWMAPLLKRDSNTCVFLWILQNIKIICFEENLRTAASIRCYFGTIILKQSTFCTTYLFQVLISKIMNLKKYILQFSHTKCFCNVLLRNPQYLPIF